MTGEPLKGGVWEHSGRSSVSRLVPPGSRTWATRDRNGVPYRTETNDRVVVFRSGRDLFGQELE